MKIYKLLPVFSLLFFVACGDDSSSVNSVDPETSSSSEKLAETSSSFEKGKSSSSVTKKSSSSSAEKEKSSSSKAQVSSSSKVDVPSSSSANVILTDPIEIFKPRVPKAAAYHCSAEDRFMGGSMEIDFDQQDWICTFKYAGKEGFVYVQGTPTSCKSVGMGMNPEISVDTAVLYVNGKYATPKNLSYEWGGNHHNDKFRFTYDGKVYEYFHSSHGFGGRSCQEMDCMRVYEADGTTLIEDGCKTFDDNLSEVRSLPVVCRFASLDDGSFGDFTDTFELCVGDFRLDMDQE